MNSHYRAYIVITALWLLVDLVFWLFPPGYILSGHEISDDRILLDVSLMLAGALAIRLSLQSGFAGFLSGGGRYYFAIAALGAALGILNILLDLQIGLGDIHADFPAAIPNYFTGALYSEVLYKLLPLSILHWLVSDRLLNGRYSKPIFWILAILISFYEPYKILQMAGNPNIPGNLSSAETVYSLVAVNYFLNMVGSLIFRRNGFLSTLFLRWGFYLTWHIVWPLVYY